MLSGYKMTTIGLMDELRENIKPIKAVFHVFVFGIFLLRIDVDVKRQYHGPYRVKHRFKRLFI
jgi:hypothetical protein